MEYTFRSPVTGAVVFIVLIIIYSIVPLVSVPFAFKDIKWKILGTLIAYIALSPFLIIFIVLLVKTSSISITINPDYIIYRIKKDTVTLQTRETEYFIYEYIIVEGGEAGGHCYQVFELGNGMQKVRFTYRLSSPEIKELEKEVFEKGKFKKAIQFASYGLTVLKKEKTHLVTLVTRYTGHEPLHKPGFFNRDDRE
jgi:hypothetical protein